MSWRSPKELSGKLNRSLSLWDAIPYSRTCEEAGVAAHWCACLNWETVSVSDETVGQLGRELVERLNNETERVRDLCAALSLGAVESARRLVPHADVLRYKKAKDADGFLPDLSGKGTVSLAQYQLRVRTQPGNALYEATIPFHLVQRQAQVNLDAVSHINAFGDLPHCIINKDYFLAKYCVCHDRVPKS